MARGGKRPGAGAKKGVPQARTLEKPEVRDLLRRLGLEPGTTALLQPAHSGDTLAVAPVFPPSIDDRWNAALGCKTSEVALAILAQVVSFERQRVDTASDDQIEAMLIRPTAMLAELQPTTATEALLAAQMVSTQRLAMTFLRSSELEGQTVQAVDSHILRATRLMRLFNEQVETMARLKGKGGQQRVVVEHVTVTAGGQAAIVGAVIPAGRGSGGDDQR